MVFERSLIYFLTSLKRLINFNTPSQEARESQRLCLHFQQASLRALRQKEAAKDVRNHGEDSEEKDATEKGSHHSYHAVIIVPVTASAGHRTSSCHSPTQSGSFLKPSCATGTGIWHYPTVAFTASFIKSIQI